jgi:hypothetical protein
VFGDLPTIESGEIERTHNATIKPKKFSECKTLDEQAEWLELADMQDSDEYKICKASIKVQKLAKKIDMETLMRLIDERSIPPQFMMRLASGVETFKHLQGGSVSASVKQVQMLKSSGINPPPTLSANEAAFIIHSLTGEKVNHHNSQTFVAQEGKFKGSHIKDLTWPYKQAILKKAPQSHLADQIRQYHKLKPAKSK